MSRWRPTSDAAADLIASLRHQPLLVGLRPSNPQQAVGAITALAALGVHHVELAWRADPAWVGECRELIQAFPGLRLGAASLCSAAALEDARSAGFSYAVSPVLDRDLVEQAGPDLVLVPGVMTPTEVHQARVWGCALVKLFPAAPLGASYWRRLVPPLGTSLPFCIAAGGLAAGDVLPWLGAGVDAVALGSSLRVSEAGELDGEGPLRSLVTSLTARSRLKRSA
jgi:2-dehydro-3-deoxyphosphogluconate aldolase/(4S)-4-hydroxy-2-oxoglutarate aldolase